MSAAEILCNDTEVRRQVGDMATTVDLTQPDFLTVEQAAAVIGIGRTCAYQLRSASRRLRRGHLPRHPLRQATPRPTQELEDLTGGPITIPALTDDTTPASTTSHDQPDATTNTDHQPTTTTVTTPTDLPQRPLPYTE